MVGRVLEGGSASFITVDVGKPMSMRNSINTVTPRYSRYLCTSN